MGLFLFQKQVGQDGREKRSYGDNHPDIGGHCAGERDIFQQIVQAYPAQACGGKGQFLLPVRSLQAPGINDQQGQQPHDEAKEQYLYRLEIGQQNFRACLKNVKTPKQRIFFRCAALKILEIRQDSCEFLPCPAKKSLAVGHSAIYQTSPRQAAQLQITQF